MACCQMHANLGTNHFGEIDPKKGELDPKKGGADQVVQFFYKSYIFAQT